ncbi:MAG TPA: protein-disulfide reductase DsbD, partial [Chromatiales bacterium]|nr:protein-disulfide reductase DsbD [Chromatiales bacterium]HEX21959.1 protein-disulfide reductase DsbD [Chromatiales bacterium]
MTLIKHLAWLLLATTIFSPTSYAAYGGAGNEEPLMPDEAFKLSARMLDANTLRAEWEIADDYYLYRDKFKFEPQDSSVTLGEGNYPPGKIKDDEFFGRMETYRKHVAIDIPVSGASGSLTLDITSQGCADMGICYPPQTKTVTLDIPAAGTASSDTGSSGFNPLGALKKLGASLGLASNDDEFLTAEQAFIPSIEAIDGNTLRAHFEVADGVYLYRDKIAFSVKNAPGISLGKPTLPPGDVKVDESFGEMVVYHNSVDLDIPVIRSNLDATEITVVINYQGCADAGFCYPPTSTEIPVMLPAVEAATVDNTPPATSTSDGPAKSEQDRIADSLASGSTILTILTFFGFGLLLAFTPCVFPMIPILSSIIVGQGDELTTRRAFIMSLVYVLAMALTYTVAGVIAGLFGENLQAAFQNPWILGTFSAVFVALAFSMFGFFELQMPSFLQSRLTKVSNKQKGGTLTGVAVMGFLSALIVGPCVAAPLAGALIYIGQTGDAVLGGMALFALSMGMGAPLLAIGTSAGKLLPKAGGWMNVIKAVFGVMLLAVAIWMLERIIPVSVAMLLWAALLIISAVYMGALEPVGEGSGWRKLWKGVGVIGLIYGTLMLAGVATGGKDTLQPLHGLAMGIGMGSTTGTSQSTELQFKKIKGLQQLEQEIAAASAAG